MGGEDANGPESVGEMRKRRTLMADGRYLIYFTFGDEDEAPRATDEGATARPEPEAEPVAEEERRV
ncbi:MAG: hypothetical protein M3416_20970 [Acidobacteriota bacterium]|nr:hypothetical protein [Acidobacteriota bacterium]